MSTNYPTSLDTLTNPEATTNKNTLSHAGQHANANDAIEALQAKVGADSSTVGTSIDYLVKNTSSSDPGHKHTLANGATDVTASASELNQLDGVTLPTTIVGTTDTQTLTNKRVTPRVTTEVSSATPTINTDNSDAHSITALATDITSMTTNLSGTPTDMQKLIIRFKDDGTARAITWGISFEAKGTDLPTTTTISKVLTVGLIYDTVTSKWGCVAVSTEA